MKRFLLPLLAGVLLPAGLNGQFVDKAGVAGVDLSYPTDTTGHTDPALDPNGVGSASCACDLDGDGWTDLIVTRAGQPCLVFINNRDGTFREEASLRGLDTVSDIGGIAAGDFANKGSVDLFMVPVSGPRYFLFVNDGTGHFQEKAIERGADSTVTTPLHQGQSVALVDYDRDGYLDIYVTEWSVPTNGQNALYSVLLHNKGQAAPGFFENKTAAAGLVQPPSFIKHAGYSAAWADLDGDGYPDLFLAADFGTSQLWWNNGDGTFTNGTGSSGIANGADDMGVALLDFDGDGKLDIFVTAISVVFQGNGTGYISDNKLFRNLGGRHFAEVATTAGVKNSGWGWGTGSLDANNDGRPDLVATGGYYTPAYTTFQSDPTKLFINGGGTFTDQGAAFGITDTGLGRSAAILDYDNDGREDIFITNSVGHRILYHNETSAANAHWLALHFVGATSNRDGYGALVAISAGGHSQTAWYNPTGAYIGQREPRLHFGLGASTVVDNITVTWPSGVVQQLTNVAANQTVTVAESVGIVSPPTITADPAGVAAPKDSQVVLTVTGQGSPAPVYIWSKDGVKIAGQIGASLTISKVKPIDAGTYTVSLINPYGTVTSKGAVVTVTANLNAKSVARWWDEAILDGIRTDIPNPPVHARNLYHLSAALWDSYWAYERNGWLSAEAMFDQENVSLPADEPGRLAAQQQAMSYAAYTLIKQRYKNSPGYAATLAGINWLMQQYGYDPAFSDATGTSPASVGLRIGQQLIGATLNDGSNEANNYVDGTGFVAANPPLVVRTPGVGANVNPDFWQPLNLVNTVTQNGIVLGSAVQKFVGSNAINTRTWALPRNANRYPANDPGAPPSFTNPATQAAYVQQALGVIQLSSQLATADAVTLDISPGHILNNPLGTNDGTGHPTNPVTGQPYPSNVVLRGDYSRVLAEFWADGPSSETPPGHWNLLFNQASDNPLCPHQFLGAGSPLPRLQWDVLGYMALNAALHDAACAAWSLKWEYDTARPITMIRYLASLGQSSDPNQASYNPAGLPLVPGLIEVITAESSAPGQRHAALAGSVGQIAINSWKGTPPDPTQTSGVGWILATTWVPYQKDSFVTPAFPGYISGHSTFSRSAAEVLARLTGSDYFPGGLATYDFPAGTFLTFEAGPTQHVQLQWATYFDAADQAGLSRLYGGIHIAADDFTGRRMGSKVGIDAFNKFLTYFTMTPGAAPVIASQPASATATAGQSTGFSVMPAFGGGVSYQWQRRAAGSGTWTDLADGGGYTGTSTASLGVTPATGMNGDQYRCVVTNGTGSTTSNAVTLNVRMVANDFNADSRADLFWQNTVTGECIIWTMSGTSFLSSSSLGVMSTDWTVAAIDDFNGDLLPDLVLQNTVTGERAIWLLNGGAFVSGVSLGIVPVEWSIAGTGDFNGDGQTDILWQNTVTGERAIWLMNGTGFASGLFLGIVPAEWSVAAVADFNADGQADILWANTRTGEADVWLLNGGAFGSGVSLGSVPLPLQIAGAGDYNGDGQPDLLLTNTLTGERSVWLMNGTNHAGTVSFGTVSLDWTLNRTVLHRAPADFNADGNSDLLWQNIATGERALWLMQGTGFVSGVALGTITTDWSIAASADFNHDGKPDLLWQNAATGERVIWLMDGTAFLSSKSLGVVPTDWSIAGTGDFNGDGQIDIVWQNTVTGERHIWYMNGPAFGSDFPLANAPTDWTIAGTGDFNGDGKPDILWQNTTTGQRVIWLLNGTGFLASVDLGTVSTDWTIAGTGDFNGDGQTDIIWQNTVTGERVIWLMSGTTYQSSVSLGSVPVQWSLVR